MCSIDNTFGQHLSFQGRAQGPDPTPLELQIFKKIWEFPRASPWNPPCRDFSCIRSHSSTLLEPLHVAKFYLLTNPPNPPYIGKLRTPLLLFTWFPHYSPDKNSSTISLTKLRLHSTATTGERNNVLVFHQAIIPSTRRANQRSLQDKNAFKNSSTHDVIALSQWWHNNLNIWWRLGVLSHVSWDDVSVTQR